MSNFEYQNSSGIAQPTGGTPVQQADGSWVSRDGQTWQPDGRGGFRPFSPGQGASNYALANGQQATEGGDEWGMVGSLNDPNSTNSRDFYYRGDAGAANADADRARAWAQMVQQRQGVQADLGQANASRGMLTEQQQTLVNASHGQGPSMAGLQNTAQLGAIEQQTAAAHAAPRLSLAMAQRAGIMGAGNASAGAAAAAAGTRAQEIQGARGEAIGINEGLRKSDQAQAMAQAQLAARQRALNDAASAAGEQHAMNVARMGMEGQQAQGAARRTWAGMAQTQGQHEQDQQDAQRTSQSNALIGGFSALYKGVGSMGMGG